MHVPCPGRSIILLCGVVFAMPVACAERTPTSDGHAGARPRFLEDLFSGMSLSVDRRSQDVCFSLKEGVDPEYAACEIEAYLRKQPGARVARDIPGAYAERSFVSERQFWGMVLAQLRGFDLEALAEERPGEDLVEIMLRQIAASAGKYPARKDPGYSDVAEALAEPLVKIHPLLAAYLGVPEAHIARLRVRSGPSPLSREVALHAGLQQKHVLSSMYKPRRLASEAQYTWAAWVDFRLGQQQLGEFYVAACYYDSESHRWVLDDIVIHDIATMNERPVAPAEGWNPTVVSHRD